MKKKDILYLTLPTIISVAVVVIVVVVALIFKGREESYRSIRVVELEGDVFIDRESLGNLEASVNMNLISGDRISTAKDAYVVLQLDEDKYVMLGEQGAIQVFASGNAADGRTQIHLETGTILNDIQNSLSQNSAYEIYIPGVALSVRGTVFEVRWRPDDSRGELLVYEGSVALTLEGKDPELYSHGEYTQFQAGDTPQFLIEHETITDEHMDPQVMPFLYQILISGRVLYFGSATNSIFPTTSNGQDGSWDVYDWQGSDWNDGQGDEASMTKPEIMEVSGEARVEPIYPNSPTIDLTDTIEKRYLDDGDLLYVFGNSYVKLRTFEGNEIIMTAHEDTYGLIGVVFTDICLETGSMLINAQESSEWCSYSLGIKTSNIVSVENGAILEIYFGVSSRYNVPVDEYGMAAYEYGILVYEGTVTAFENEIHSGQYAIYDGTNVDIKNISDDMSIMEKSEMVWYLVENWGSGLCFDHDEWDQLAELAGQS